jgi:chemotaxis protein methyltransferase CheR
MYRRFRDLLQSRAGLFYPEHRRDDMAHGLSQVLAVGRHASLSALYDDATAGGEGWNLLLVHLTVGETRFFRNEAHFDALRQRIIPDIISRRLQVRTVRLWSAGCASGEEPYSLAILLTELLPNIETWSANILATDINPNFLERARQGLYSAWSFRETPDSLRSRYFSEEQGRWRLDENIRRMVSFSRLNLAEPTYPSITNGTYALDMIICRNVTIYFDQATTRQVVERFYASLSPGGWLIVGHSEPQVQLYARFETHNFPNAIIYRKPLDAPLFAAAKPAEAASSQATPSRVRLSTNDKGAAAPAHPSDKPPQPASTKGSSLPSSDKGRATRPLSPLSADVSTRSRNDTWTEIRSYLEQGDKIRAETLLRDFLQSEPLHTEGLLTLARLCADRGNWREAQLFCEQALASNPLSVEASYLLGQVYEHAGHLEDALAAYRRTTYANREFVLGMLGMARVWRQMGQVAEARRGYRSLLKQLATMPGSLVLRDADGATVGELMAFAQSQLETLL